MKVITYTIVDKLGIHAYPAGKLVKKAGEFESDIQIGKNGIMVNAKKIMGVMGLAVEQGDQISMTFQGTDEEQAAFVMESFLKENL